MLIAQFHATDRESGVQGAGGAREVETVFTF